MATYHWKWQVVSQYCMTPRASMLTTNVSFRVLAHSVEAKTNRGTRAVAAN